MCMQPCKASDMGINYACGKCKIYMMFMILNILGDSAG